ncbi:MAG: tetratricopeptide repeat protein [Acidobacteria bacterium]|nr:tetratricopeptide repeat protein [Acidobacteriota bacterium]
MWDDQEQVLMNPDLRPNVPLARLFSSDVWGFRSWADRGRGNYYRPLQMCAYRFTAEATGQNPSAFHLLSLLLAIACAVAVFALFWQLSGTPALAFCSAALFAVHPVHTEAVDWISALPDLGCTFFVLLSFITLIAAEQTRGNATLSIRTAALKLLSLLSFATALLWKEPAAVLPILAFLYWLTFRKEGTLIQRMRVAAIRSVPYWIVLAGYLLLRVHVLTHLAIRQRNWPLTPAEYCLTAIKLLMTYWWNLILPVDLNAYHVFSPAQSGMFVLLALGFVAGACLACAFAFRRFPLACFAALWVFITLLPVLDIYAVGRNVFAERYLYLPSAGFCLLVAALAASGLRFAANRYRRYAAAGLLIAVVAGYAAETYARNPDWKDNSTLFERTLEQSPDAPFVRNMVAASLLSSDASSRAEEQYQAAASLAAQEHPPDYLQLALAEEGLASIYADRSEFSRAIETLEQVRKANPTDPEVDGEEGLILARAERWQEAEICLQRAVVNRHENENVLNALGIVAWRHQKRLDLAADYFRRALSVHTATDDFSASVHDNLGAVYGEQGQLSEAIREFRIATDMDQRNPDYHTNLAQVLVAAGNSNEALDEIHAALRLDPSYFPARALETQITGVAARR